VMSLISQGRMGIISSIFAAISVIIYQIRVYGA
jgi:hypothetical protein